MRQLLKQTEEGDFLWSCSGSIFILKGRLYTRHAVERSYPASIGGRSIAPAFIEEVVRTGTVRKVVVGRIERKIHTSGTVQIVTEDDGNIVVTVNPFSGGKKQ